MCLLIQGLLIGVLTVYTQNGYPNKNRVSPTQRPTLAPRPVTTTKPTISPLVEMEKMKAKARRVQMEMMFDVYDLAVSMALNNLDMIINLAEPVILQANGMLSRFVRGLI